MKIFHILILVLILSCDSNKKLEGNWIGTYSTLGKIDTPMDIPIQTFVSFENNQYFAKRFGEDFSKGTYEYKWNRIYYNSIKEDNTIIELLNDNKLVTRENMGSNDSKFEKLHDSLKSNTNLKLIGKRFLIKSEIYADTLNFINDTLVIRSTFKTIKSGVHWERFKQNGFDILFMEMDIPYLIRENLDNKTILTGHWDKKFDLELIELE